MNNLIKKMTDREIQENILLTNEKISKNMSFFFWMIAGIPLCIGTLLLFITLLIHFLK